MNHELRTLLTGILGMTEVLLDSLIFDGLNDRQKQTLHKISLSVVTLAVEPQNCFNASDWAQSERMGLCFVVKDLSNL